jgi:hypothetical protein
MQTIASSEKDLVDRYFAEVTQGIPSPESTTAILENFGLNAAHRLPMRDMRGRKWRLDIKGCTTSLCVMMGGGAYRVPLASTTIYRGDKYQMLMVLGSPDLGIALCILENHQEQQ